VIEDDEVGAEPANLVNCLLPIGGRPHHLDISLAERQCGLEQATYGLVVIHDQYSQGHVLTFVGFLGGLSVPWRVIGSDGRAVERGAGRVER
jgi:hypothetical protein